MRMQILEAVITMGVKKVFDQGAVLVHLFDSGARQECFDLRIERMAGKTLRLQSTHAWYMASCAHS